jgi:adenosylcobyric acid synthase
MLGGAIDDPEGVEGGGSVRGLDLLPVATRFAVEKTLGRPAPTSYEIHHGVVTPTGAVQGFGGGCRAGSVWGTIWHGLLDDDAARHAFLTEIAAAVGKPGPDGGTSFRALREDRLDRLADAVEAHLDTEQLLGLIEKGPPAGLPFVPPGAP